MSPVNKEERREINRENGKKSRGPTTDEGKAKSRANAMKHGLRAEVLALPNEKPEIIQGRATAWNDYYQPASPAAQHLVNECVRATILSDRCHAYHDATLAKQVREATHQEQSRNALEIERIVANLVADPSNSVAALLRFGPGCGYLIERWERLGQILDKDGVWLAIDRDEAIRLQGFSADDDDLKNCEAAWTTRFYNLVSHAKPNQTMIDWMTDSKHIPANLRAKYGPQFYPDGDDCRDALKEMVAEKLASLRPLAAELAESFDIPNTASAADRASILHDEKAAKLFLRYHAESRTAFHRAFGALVKTLASDAAEAAEAATSPAVSPNEPKIVTVEEPVKAEAALESTESEASSDPDLAVSPNEPNFTSAIEPDPAQTAEKDGPRPNQRAA